MIRKFFRALVLSVIFIAAGINAVVRSRWPAFLWPNTEDNINACNEVASPRGYRDTTGLVGLEAPGCILG